MRIFLVRHGETAWNKEGRFQGHCDIPLNELGLSQARDAALAAISWDHKAVYTSPLHRTMQVAEEISRLAGTPVVPMPGLKELSLGDLEGVTGEEMRNNWPQVSADWRRDPGSVSMPNGESLVQLQQRAWAAIEEIAASHGEDDTLVAVSHNFAIRTIVAKLIGMPLSNFHAMVLSLAAICTIEKVQWGWRLTGYNSTNHLSDNYR